MLRLSTISRKLQENEWYGTVHIRYTCGTITLYVTHPRRPFLYGYGTKWTEDEGVGKQHIRVIECTIPERMIVGTTLDTFRIGVDTYLLPEAVFDRLTSKWKNVTFR